MLHFQFLDVSKLIFHFLKTKKEKRKKPFKNLGIQIIECEAKSFSTNYGLYICLENFKILRKLFKAKNIRFIFIKTCS